ncbi:MAG TPA: S-methyl-5-thioribose-1-phosphate isomerase [Syntrophorhabdaceae bacterium]|nr:S-methyl-5-thioribose-1-phosphate isomerase [Syntrophorhabdaceae bacterium]HPP06921.1 S-methyl-5-thioribose-1-phosphate isomerase [Syntrophorhabdaceae bacterium]
MTDHIYWKDDALFLLDQRELPFKKLYVRCNTLKDVRDAIKNMIIRGAPLIGIVAAYGFVIGIKEILNDRGYLRERDIKSISRTLLNTRPTAANLLWALKRMETAYNKYKCKERRDLETLMLDEAVAIHVEDIENNRMISLFGAELIKDGDNILTHCNAGSLAMGGYGTALGVIKAAHESGKKIKVFATETRPYFQGARLTAWELYMEGIDVEVIPDNHVGILCYKGLIDKVIVGADRIALNGDTANKVGTFMIALCAKAHSIPFYVAAPTSTFDPEIESGALIPIEERGGEEVKKIKNIPITLKQVRARYYSFDVTSHRYISLFITEKGIIKRPFKKYIEKLFL